MILVYFESAKTIQCVKKELLEENGLRINK